MGIETEANDSAPGSRARYEIFRTFLKDKDELMRRYALYHAALPLDDRIIFYESMSGKRMMDNPMALFRAAYADPRFADHIHVWSVANYDVIPEIYRNADNIIFVTRNTDIYLRYLAQARHVICNSVLPEYFVRKHGQKYLNTWHGIAYKRVGRSPEACLGGAYSVYNLLQATHILSPCPFMSTIQLDTMGMRGTYSGELAETGYPRIDMTLGLPADTRSALIAELHLDPGKKTVLYAPTWRSADGENTFDTERLVNDLEALSGLDANIIFLGHHLMSAHIKGMKLGFVKMPPPDTNTNELLGIADILVTDYSSIFFDFLVTGRPIIHYMYDYEDYYARRGLNLKIEDLPGLIAFDAATLLVHLQTCLNAAPDAALTQAYDHARQRFCPHEDGAAAQRALDWFFFGDTSAVQIVPRPEQRSVAFWGGRLDDGKKTEAFMEMLRARARDDSCAVTLIVARSVDKNRKAMKHIAELGPDVNVVSRVGHGMLALPEEEEARKAVEHGERASAGAVFLHQRLYEREYMRVFGEARFDENIEFSGNSTFWKELVKAGTRLGRRGSSKYSVALSYLEAPFSATEGSP